MAIATWIVALICATDKWESLPDQLNHNSAIQMFIYIENVNDQVNSMYSPPEPYICTRKTSAYIFRNANL